MRVPPTCAAIGRKDTCVEFVLTFGAIAAAVVASLFVFDLWPFKVVKRRAAAPASGSNPKQPSGFGRRSR